MNAQPLRIRLSTIHHQPQKRCGLAPAFTLEQFATRYDLKVRDLSSMIGRGVAEPPKPAMLYGKRRYYRLNELQAWIKRVHEMTQPEKK